MSTFLGYVNKTPPPPKKKKKDCESFTPVKQAAIAQFVSYNLGLETRTLSIFAPDHDKLLIVYEPRVYIY